MALSSKSRRRGLMAEINVVPYIDAVSYTHLTLPTTSRV